jgi:hypothetical protein
MFFVPFVDVSIGIYVMVLDKTMDENMFFLLPFVDVSIMLNLDSDIFI